MNWTVAIETDGEARDYVVDNEHGRIATLWDGTNYQHAALIAAAPEMLTALKAACAWVDMYLELPGHEPAARSMGNCIRAAIAKAEGRT